jgi:alpha-1,3-mannosyltransferase
MKILHFTHRFWPAKGGIEDVVENLCAELYKKGIQSDVLTINLVDGQKLKKHEKKGKINITRLDFFDLKYYKITTFPVELIKKYDIIHLHSLGFFSDLILATKPFHKKKIIISTHGGIFHTKNINKIKQTYFHSIEKTLFKNADKIIAVSKADKKLFKQIAPEKKIILIENGFTAPEPKGKKKKNTFLVVGRLSKNKNIGRLFEVFAGIKSKYFMYIAGKDFDNLLNLLEDKARNLGIEKKIRFLGEITDKELRKLYSKSEYYISASKYEGFGITAIEAMHYGCVTILNRIPTFKEFASNGRGNIVDFEKKDAASKIEKIIQKNHFTQRKKAKAYSKKFLWKYKVKDFIKIYEGL